jgi:hypothetical protein
LPLNVPIEALPNRLTVPPLIALMVLAPVTVTAPPLMPVEEVSAPTTFTAPAVIDVIAASLAKLVVPVPERLVSVVVPVAAEKLAVPELASVPSDAFALESTAIAEDAIVRLLPVARLPACNVPLVTEVPPV